LNGKMGRSHKATGAIEAAANSHCVGWQSSLSDNGNERRHQPKGSPQQAPSHKRKECTEHLVISSWGSECFNPSVSQTADQGVTALN
jgi:hypothetical protein